MFRWKHKVSFEVWCVLSRFVAARVLKGTQALGIPLEKLNCSSLTMCFRLWSFIWCKKSQENCFSSESLDLTINFSHEFRFIEWFGRGRKATLVLTCAPVVLQGAAAFAFPQRWVQDLVEALVNEHQPLLQLALALLPVAGQDNHRQMFRAAAAQNV